MWSLLPLDDIIELEVCQNHILTRQQIPFFVASGAAGFCFIGSAKVTLENLNYDNFKYCLFIGTDSETSQQMPRDFPCHQLLFKIPIICNILLFNHLDKFHIPSLCLWPYKLQHFKYSSGSLLNLLERLLSQHLSWKCFVDYNMLWLKKYSS